MASPGVSVAGIAVEGGKLLIARRLAGGDLGEKWEFPGGKVEAGEGEAEALIREYREELGLRIAAGPLIAESVFEHRGLSRILRAYRIYLLTRDFSLIEHSAWRWAALEEIEGLDFAPSDLRLLPGLKAYLEA